MATPGYLRVDVHILKCIWIFALDDKNNFIFNINFVFYTIFKNFIHYYFSRIDLYYVKCTNNTKNNTTNFSKSVNQPTRLVGWSSQFFIETWSSTWLDLVGGTTWIIFWTPIAKATNKKSKDNHKASTEVTYLQLKP